MDWLTLWFALQAGMISQEIYISPDHVWRTPENAFEVTMDMKAVIFEHVEIGGFMRSFQVPAEFPYFAPFRIDYGARIAFILGPFSVGVENECDHPVGSPGLNKPYYGMNKAEYFIRYETKIIIE